MASRCWVRRLLPAVAVALALLPAAPAGALGLMPVNLTPPVLSGTAQEGHSLTCSDGTWLNSPTSHTRQWNRDGSAISLATGTSYTVQAADVNHAITCAVTAANADGPSLLAATSLPVVPIAATADQRPVNLTPPVLSGTAQEGKDLSCSDGTWLFSPSSYVRKWRRDGVAISGATSPGYTVQAADVGHSVTCSVAATNGAGTSAETTSLPVVPIAAVDTGKPVNLTPPVLSGTAQEGKDLSCSDGTWLNGPTSYTRKWRRDGVAISGATAATYTVQTADVGHAVTCSVTATNSAGASAETTSLPVVPIAAVDTGKPVNLTPPVLSGTAQQGQSLTCSDGTWLNSPTSYSRQWKRDGSDISGATGTSYTVQAADVAHAVSCSVVATNAAGGSAAATSLPVVPIPSVDTAKPISLVPPIVTGTAQQGQDVVCSDGTWLNSPGSYARQWKRDGTAIAGATGAGYTVQAADVAHQLTCSVVATNGAGSSAPATSLPVVPIAAFNSAKPVNLTPPVITGTAQQGHDLSCSDGTWLNAPASYARQWKRDGSAIAGATGAVYTVQAADVAHQVTCSVVATNSAGDSAEATSLPVVPIAPVNTAKPISLAPPVIVGGAQQGRDLSCSDGTWLNAPASYARQWKRDGTPIAGATAAVYTVQAADVAHAVTCSVVATNGAGDSAEATSLPVVPIPAVGGGDPPPSGGSGGPAGNGPGGGTPGGSTPGPGPGTTAAVDRVAPVVSSFSVTNRRFVVGAATTALASARAKVGTTFRLRVSEPVRYWVAIARIDTGYREGKRCLRVTAALKRRLAARLSRRLTPARRAAALSALLRRGRCNLPVVMGALTRINGSGAASLLFTGRLGRVRLAPGRYLAVVIAQDAARNNSVPRQVAFDVIAPPKPKPRPRARR